MKATRGDRAATRSKLRVTSLLLQLNAKSSTKSSKCYEMLRNDTIRIRYDMLVSVKDKIDQ